MALGSRTLLNLGLALGVALLALLAIYEPGKAPPKEQPRLIALSADGISKMRIERLNGPAIVLERQRGSWRMTEPLQLPINDYRISSLLRVSETPVLSSFEVQPQALAQYGLDTPSATLILNDTTRIEFGNSTPLDQRRYVRTGNTIHLISDTLYYFLIGVPTSYASNALLDDKVALQRLELPNLTLALQQGKWQASPAPAEFSADQVTQLIDHWRHAQALEVTPYDGRKGESVRLFSNASEHPVEFIITQRTPELILARADLKVQYHLPAASVVELMSLKPIPAQPPAAVTAAPSPQP